MRDQYFTGKYFCGPSGHHGSGLPASLAKLVVGGRGCRPTRQPPDCRGQGISKVRFRPQWFKKRSRLAKPNEAVAMGARRSFLTHSSCMFPEVSVRNLSRCLQKAPHLDTPPQTPAVLPCGEEPMTHTPASVLLPGDTQTRPRSPAEAVSREKVGDTGTHMEKVISTASTSAQRPHMLSQGSCRTHFEVQVHDVACLTLFGKGNLLCSAFPGV